MAFPFSFNNSYLNPVINAEGNINFNPRRRVGFPANIALSLDRIEALMQNHLLNEDNKKSVSDMLNRMSAAINIHYGKEKFPKVRETFAKRIEKMISQLSPPPETEAMPQTSPPLKRAKGEQH
jgi:hypothetical protein